MDTTTNLGLNKPAENDFYDVNDFNQNADKIDEEIAKKADRQTSTGGFTAGRNAKVATVEGTAIEYMYIGQWKDGKKLSYVSGDPEGLYDKSNTSPSVNSAAQIFNVFDLGAERNISAVTLYVADGGASLTNMVCLTNDLTGGRSNYIDVLRTNGEVQNGVPVIENKLSSDGYIKVGHTDGGYIGKYRYVLVYDWSNVCKASELYVETDTAETPIPAIQLGEGTNEAPYTLQVYGYQLLDANGNIPTGRLQNISGSIAAKADKVYNDGFIGGKESALKAQGGAAIGNKATASSGAALGKNAQASEGGAAGEGAYTSHGGSVGKGAYSLHGGAVGRNAKTYTGAAIGDGAQTVNESGEAIDAIQLGTGTNSTPKTLQAYEYTLMDAEGKIPVGRMSKLANIKKNPNSEAGDIVAMHLTVGSRTEGSSYGYCSFTSGILNSAIGANSAVLGGYQNAVTNPDSINANINSVIVGGNENTTTNINSAIVGGTKNTANGQNCAVIGGSNNSATGVHSAVIGGANNEAADAYSVVMGGISNLVSGACGAVIGGNHNEAIAYQLKSGHYSKTGNTGANSGTGGDAFILGNGISDSERSNCFRVDYAGNVYGLSAFTSSGAGVAELHEWADGNPDNEDRRGLFLTLDGDKIKIAEPEDDYIIGVIDPLPFVVGDAQSEVWCGMYKRDVFGAYETDEEGSMVINPDYDPTQEYEPRENRTEFAAVSNWGKIVLIDDGTAEVNGYVKNGEGGKATKSEQRTLYRVMSRIDENHIYVKVGSGQIYY